LVVPFPPTNTCSIPVAQHQTTSRISTQNANCSNLRGRRKYQYRLISPKGIVQFWSCNKAETNVFPHKAELSSAARTGQYLLD